MDLSYISKSFENIILDLDNKYIDKQGNLMNDEDEILKEQIDKVPVNLNSRNKPKFINANATSSDKNEFNLKLLKKREKDNSVKKVFQLSLENKPEKQNKIVIIEKLSRNEKVIEKSTKKLLSFEPKLDNQFINDSEHNLSNYSITLNKLNKEKIVVHSKSVILTPSNSLINLIYKLLFKNKFR